MANDSSYTFIEFSESNAAGSDPHGYHQQLINDEECIIEYLDEELEDSQNYMELEVSDAHGESDCEPAPETKDAVALKRRWWTREETLALIECVGKLYINLKDPGDPVQKKNAWNSISRQLQQRNFSMSPKECSIKWRNLMRSYVKIKRDKKHQKWTLKFEYFEEMDEIVSKHALYKNAHSISSLDTVGFAIPAVCSEAAGLEHVSPNVDASSARAQPRKVNKHSQKLRSRKHLARMRKEWQLRQEEWEQRHLEKCQRLLLYQEKLELRAKKLELLERYLELKERQIMRK